MIWWMCDGEKMCCDFVMCGRLLSRLCAVEGISGVWEPGPHRHETGTHSERGRGSQKEAAVRNHRGLPPNVRNEEFFVGLMNS